MCNVVFITPNLRGAENEETIGTLQLATILKQKGISCEILQMFRFGNLTDFSRFVSNALEMVAERNPKIVSFYCRCDTYHIVLRLAEKIKERFPHIFIVLGGPQSDIVSEQTIANIPWVDFVCCGEGENTTYPFFASLLSGTPDTSMDGLVYRDGDVIRKNPRPALISDLDTLPMCDYSMFAFSDVKATIGIDVGRGCPFNCTFCSTNSFWGRKYRLKSPQRIYEEVRNLYENYGKRKFSFAHDMFTLNREKVIETCHLLKPLAKEISWGCSARLDCLDEELIDIMADAGMEGIYIGVETGSPRMQKLIHKNLDLTKMLPIANYMKKKGLGVKASFIYGFPEETEEDVRLTMAMLRDLLHLGNTQVQTHLCAFFEGTELSRKYAAEMTPVDIVSDQTGSYAIEECKDLIQKYPPLFQHMLEYKTELRGKLRFFHIFFICWSYMEPVFYYLSKKYSEEHLLNMYYDFADANYEIMKDIEDPYQNNAIQHILEQDRFLSRFAEDPHSDLIADILRFCSINTSEAVQNGDEIVEIFSFNPQELKEKSLEEMSPGFSVVTWKNKKYTVSFSPLDL